MPVEELDLHGGEECLGHGVGEAATDGAHRAEQADRVKSLSERPRHVLAVVIAVVHPGRPQAGGARSPSAARRRPARPGVNGEGEAHDPTAARADHRREVHQPSSVRCWVIPATHSRSSSATVKARAPRSSLGSAAGSRRVQLPRRRRWNTLETVGSRQPFDPLPTATDRHPELELSMDPAGALECPGTGAP